MKWPKPGDIIAFRRALGASTTAEADFLLDSGLQNGAQSTTSRPLDDANWRRLRFDNAIRLWVAIPTYLTCLALHAGGAIGSLLPISAVVIGYAAIVYFSLTLFFNTRFHRVADYLLSLTDLAGMSVAVFLTGAATSPLYFIYFVPVIIHAFHRDWNMILFSGFGGVLFYGLAIFATLTSLNSAAMADLFARMIFMLLTVAVTCLALSVLRRDEQHQVLKIARLRAAASIGSKLTGACSGKEIFETARVLAPLMESALSVEKCQVNLVFTESSVPGLHIPIETPGDVPFGSISILTPGNRSLSDEDFTFLKFVSRNIALSLRRLRTIAELERSLEMGTAVAAVYLAADRSPEAARSVFLEGAAVFLKASNACLWLWDGESMALRQEAFWSDEAGDLREKLRPRESILAGSAFSGGENLTDGDRRTLAVPLPAVGGIRAGVLELSRTNGPSFQDDELALAAAYAHRSAHAISAADNKGRTKKPVQPRLAA